jgi:hypothetical protein
MQRGVVANEKSLALQTRLALAPKRAWNRLVCHHRLQMQTIGLKALRKPRA